MSGTLTFNEWQKENRERRFFIRKLEDAYTEWAHKGKQEKYYLAGFLLEDTKRNWNDIEGFMSENLISFFNLSLEFSQNQLRREELAPSLAEKIERGDSLQEILLSAVEDLNSALKSDRVIICRITDSLQQNNQKEYGSVASYSSHKWELSEKDINLWAKEIEKHVYQAISKGYETFEPQPQRTQKSDSSFLQVFKIKSQVLMPISLDSALWGSIVTQQCSQEREWSPRDIELLRQVKGLLAIALQQDKFRQLRMPNETSLGTKLPKNKIQSPESREETLFRRITENTRDSLNENQIFEKTVQELALVMGVRACNAALYDLEHHTSTIYYEHVTTLPTSKGRVAQMANHPEIYNQLLQGQQFQFCSITPHPKRGRVSMLACPIFDHEGVLGDLWIVNDESYAFTDRDIRIVQHTANQCAIALRQARLFQATQQQVAELKKINHLKDEFLHTVSHELRTPMTNMKMGILMLDVALKRREGEIQEQQPQIDLFDSKVNHYIDILRKECERESQLINDLLDLQRLDSERQTLDLKAVDLKKWLPSIINIFKQRANDRHQKLYMKVQDGLPSLTTNIPGLERIVAELLNNACKYTPSGCEICVQAVNLDENMELSITNSGVEIPESEVTRIFDKFYRVPSNDPWKQGGTGLGLALVKKLSQHLGGDIRAESGNGETRFTVELPLNLESRQS